MGTPEFAVLPLKNLLANKDFEVIAIYTKEPKKANRGKKLTISPVHKIANENNIKIFTPKTLKNPQAQEEVQKLQSDLAIVVAYGLILPNEILQAPKFGCINIHPSLLPKWRGAAPIQRPIINNDKKTGVGIIKMTEELDAGDIINQEEIAINHDDDYISLSQKLSELGSKLLIKTIYQIKESRAKYLKQDHQKASYAHKILKDECLLDFNQSAIQNYNKIRGLNGSLAAYFNYKDERLKIYKAQIIDESKIENEIGSISDDFYIQCNPGIIKPQIIQRPSKKAMTLEEFLLGIN